MKNKELIVAIALAILIIASVLAGNYFYERQQQRPNGLQPEQIRARLIQLAQETAMVKADIKANSKAAGQAMATAKTNATVIITNAKVIDRAMDEVKANAVAITANTKAVGQAMATAEENFSVILDNTKLLSKTCIGVKTNALYLTALREEMIKTVAANTKTIRNYEPRIVNAQRTANRALGMTLMATTGMNAKEAKAKVNAFVIGDLKLSRLAPNAHKIPQGIKRAQTRATAGLELMQQHGSRGWFSHDKKLAQGASTALNR